MNKRIRVAADEKIISGFHQATSWKREYHSNS